MTVQSTVFFTDWLVANGVNKDWPYVFSLFDKTTVVVQVRIGLAGAITEYTSDLDLYPTDDTEGYVKYPVAGAAVANGNYVRIVRRVPYTQLTEIGNEGSFEPAIHERAFDKATMQIQQIADEGKRSLKVPLGSIGGEVVPGANNEVVVFGADGGLKTSGSNMATFNANVAQVAADRVQTGLDRVQTGADRTQTGLDRVQTGLDRTAASGSAALAQEWSSKAYESPITGFPGFFSALHWSTRAFWWGNQAEDVEVVVGSGLFSAKHWAAKAASYVAGNLGLAIHAFANKATLVDADEFVVADSANAWNGKRHTWAQLKTMIGIGLNQRLGVQQSGTVIDVDTLLATGWYFAVAGSANLPTPLAAAGAYIETIQQAVTGPTNLATKQIAYEPNGNRTFTRYRWYAGAPFSAWLDTSNFGRQTQWIPAEDWMPAITGGPQLAIGTVGASGSMLVVMDFDTSVFESAFYLWNPPKQWNASQLSFQVIWTASSGSGGVVFQLAAVAIDDAEALDIGYTNSVNTPADTLTTALYQHTTGESAAFTIQATPSKEDVVWLRLSRVVADAGDTLPADARVLGVRLFYTTDAGTDV